MSRISRVALFGKLNPVLHKAIESATVFAKLRGNPYVELSHWLYQLIQLDDSDLHRILRHYDVDGGKLAADLLAALERLPNGALAIEDLSGDIDLAAERAWVNASLAFGATAVRGAHLLFTLLTDKTLRGVTLALSPQFTRIDADGMQAAEGYTGFVPDYIPLPRESAGPLRGELPRSGLAREAGPGDRGYLRFPHDRAGLRGLHLYHSARRPGGGV